MQLKWVCVFFLMGLTPIGSFALELDPGIETRHRIGFRCGTNDIETTGTIPLLRCSNGNSIFSTQCLVGSATLGETLEIDIDGNPRTVHFSADIDLDPNRRSPTRFKLRLVKITAFDIDNNELVGEAYFFTSDFPDYFQGDRNRPIDLGAYLFRDRSGHTWGSCSFTLNRGLKIAKESLSIR